MQNDDHPYPANASAAPVVFSHQPRNTPVAPSATTEQTKTVRFTAPAGRTAAR